MKRPSFQFYPADWLSNIKLRRCSPASVGVWVNVMCVMHDSDEYGLLRWPLKEIARAVGASITHLQELADKGVLKGSDRSFLPYVFTPRHAGQDGDPVVLIEATDGPVWFSSRMVRDEYIRQRRGAGTRFIKPDQPNPIGLGSGAPNGPPKATPKVGIGDDFGDGPSSASSSTEEHPHSPRKRGRVSERFSEFWTAWPKGERKQDKAKCDQEWKRNNLDGVADAILADVRLKRGTRKWQEGFIEAPLVYLRGQRWLDGVEPDEGNPGASMGAWDTTRQGIETKGEEVGCGRWDAVAFNAGGGEDFDSYHKRVQEAVDAINLKEKTFEH